MNQIFFYESGKARGLNTNLVAYYKLDSNSNDSLGLHNGVDTGSIVYNAGKVNNAGNYGVGFRSTITTHTDFNFTTGGGNDVPFSIACWCNPSDIGQGFIFSKFGATGTDNEWTIGYHDQKFRIILSNPSASAYIAVVSTSNYPISNWYNFIVTYNGSKLFSGLKIYINGSLISVTNISAGSYTGMTASTLNPTIGNRSAAFIANEEFDGKIDELAVWKNRVLSPTDVAYLYNSGNGRTYPL